MNFDNRSLVLNDEANLMILDPDVGRQMNAVFVDDLRYSKEIQSAQFAQRSWLERLGERAANLLSRIL
jgi:phosphatidylserine/phosphatidylglycerophosphate/cardiolipin synthase-like enzyme